MNNKNKIIVFFASLFLFGCASQNPGKNLVDSKPITVPCYPQAAKQFMRWNKSKGKVLNGLTTRRQEEVNLFLTGCHD
jgi:hypothetical protein